MLFFSIYFLLMLCYMCMFICDINVQIMFWCMCDVVMKIMWWNVVFVFAVLNDILLEKMLWFLWNYYVKNFVMMYVWCCSEIYV